jgi:hypothetical protein
MQASSMSRMSSAHVLLHSCSERLHVAGGLEISDKQLGRSTLLRNLREQSSESPAPLALAPSAFRQWQLYVEEDTRVPSGATWLVELWQVQFSRAGLRLFNVERAPVDVTRHAMPCVTPSRETRRAHDGSYFVA